MIAIGDSAVSKLSRRRAIVELAHYCAAHGELGGPVEQAVVEGRAYGQGGPGSSCVELVDCCAFAAGCRAEAINRDENRGRHMQTDLGWFLPGSKHSGSIIHKPHSIEQLKPGDFLGYDFDRGGHTCIYLGQTPDWRALTADAGQPGIRLYECSIGDARGMLTLRGRAVWAAVDVDTLVYPVPALAVADWCKAHGLPDPGPVTPAEYLALQWEQLR